MNTVLAREGKYIKHGRLVSYADLSREEQIALTTAEMSDMVSASLHTNYLTLTHYLQNLTKNDRERFFDSSENRQMFSEALKERFKYRTDLFLTVITSLKIFFRDLEEKMIKKRILKEHSRVMGEIDKFLGTSPESRGSL
jgi:hypothetical protein